MSSCTFEIYNQLEKTLKPSKGNQDVIYSIQLSSDHLEIIYCIIIHHFITHHKKPARALEILNKHFKSQRSKKFIYNSERLIGGKGFIFDVEKMPDNLKDLIYTYILLITSQEN